MKSEITINDISKISGFSKSTVSKALNNYPEISDKTKFKIQKITKKYGYIRNYSASALKSKRTKIIALIVSQIASILYSSLISKIHEKALP